LELEKALIRDKKVRYRTKMAKKPFSGFSGAAWVIAIAAVVMAIVVVFTAFKPTTGAAATNPTTGGINVPVSDGSCPDSLKTAFQGDAINNLNTSATDYMVSNWRLVPDGSFSDFTAYSTAASATRATAVDLKCRHSYMLYVNTVKDAVNAIEPVDLKVVAGSTSSKSLSIPRFSLLKATAYDNFNRQYVYSSVGNTNTAYKNFGMTWEGTTDNATATTMTSSSILDWSFTIQTQNQNAQFGNSVVGTYIAVDADKDTFAVPSLWLDGVALVNVKGTAEISSDDDATLSSYEYIFKLPADLSSSPRTLRLYVEPKSGINPAKNIVLRTVAKAYSTKSDGFTEYKSIFKDSDSSELATATPQTMTLDLTP